MNRQLSQSVPDFGDRLLQFEAEWSSGKIPRIADYLREANDNDRQFVEDLIEIDLECRWKRFDAGSDLSSKDPHGFPLFPLVDDYASVLPQSLQRLIFTPHCVAEEYRVRSRWGDKPAKESFLDRFPSDRTEIEAALQQIDTDFEKEGIEIAEQSSRSVAAAAEPTLILRQTAQQDSALIPEAELIGTQIGKYQLESRLGHGGFGEVWKAYDPALKRRVAIKFPRSDKHFPAEHLEIFRTEARKVAALDHLPSGIVGVYDCGEQDGKPYFVSKFIEGESLAGRMQRERLSHEESARLIAKVAETLKRAHQQKLVHRDIKPANILLDKEGEPYLADFGMAATDEEQLSEAGGILGTYAYMAPEQARGDSHRVDGRADIYALGVILYRMLTNELPYGGKTTAQYLDNIQHQKPRPPRQIDDTIPAELERICLRCLQKDEDERYSSAGELAAELRKASDASSFKRKRTALAMTVGSLLIILLGVVLLKADRLSSRPTWANPEVIVWAPGNDLVDKYGYDEDSRSYDFDTHGGSLFKVGECQNDELTLKTRFRVQGNQQPGQAGVFWSLAPVVADQDINSCCWSVQIGRLNEFDPTVLKVRQINIGMSGGHRYVSEKYQIFERQLNDQSGPEYELEIRVTRFEIIALKVNGNQMLDAPLPLDAQPYGRAWNRLKASGYGIYGEQGSFSFAAFSTTN